MAQQCHFVSAVNCTITLNGSCLLRKWECFHSKMGSNSKANNPRPQDYCWYRVTDLLLGLNGPPAGFVPAYLATVSRSLCNNGANIKSM